MIQHPLNDDATNGDWYQQQHGNKPRSRSECQIRECCINMLRKCTENSFKHRYNHDDSRYRRKNHINKHILDISRFFYRYIYAIAAKTASVAVQVGVAMQVAETTAGEVKELSKKIDEVKQSTVSNEGVHSMIEEMIETKLAKVARKDVLRAEGSSEALFGGSGLQSATRQEAEDWVNRKLQELRAEEPTDIYHKGDEYKGILYVKFKSPEAVQKLTTAFAKGQHKLSGKQVWCKKDLPINVRVPLSFLLGLRWQLTQTGWGFTKQEVKVDDEEVPVLSATCVDDQMCLKWLDATWDKWEELQKSEELQSLIDAANAKLTRAADARGKGKGNKAPRHQ